MPFPIPFATSRRTTIRPLQVPSIPEAVVVVSRHAVHVVWAGWTHAVRRLLAGDASALQQQQQRAGGGSGGGLPPSQAFRLLQGERIDIAGASLAPQGGELLVWSLRADEAASGETSSAGGSAAWGGGGGAARVAAPGLLHRLSLFGGGSAAAASGGLVPEDGSDRAAGGGAPTPAQDANAQADTPFAELSSAFPAVARRAVSVAAQLAQDHAVAGASAPSAALADAAEALKAALEPFLHARAVTHARARQLVASATLCSSRSRALADDVGSLQVCRE